MNSIGVHNLVFVPDWSEASARKAINTAASIGFDHLEVVIFDPATTDADMTVKLSESAGIAVAAGMALNPAADISSADPDVAAKGEQVVGDCILVARDLGASALGGVTYSALHRYMERPTAAARERVTEAYARLAAKAEAAGVRLGIEPVNRYESNLVNTLGQAADIVRKVGSDSLFVQMDTYHMNIEEADIAGAIESTKDVLGYAHVGESNRGCLGSGTFDFTTYFKALARAGYTGGFTWESFSPEVQDAGTTGLLALWREPWCDVEEAARLALAFMRSHVESAWATAKGC
ncbi:MAG: sugar phosphate isomerase/epimerase [Anaerolineae bacterium]